MPNNNPFKKVEGGKPTPERSPEPRPPAPVEDARDLCPLIGGIAVPMIDQSKLVRSADPMAGIGVGFQLMPCQRERCALWNVEQEACSVRLGMDALTRLEGPLLQLGRMFGR